MKIQIQQLLAFIVIIILSIITLSVDTNHHPEIQFVQKTIIKKEIILADFYQKGVSTWWDEPDAFRKTASGTIADPYEFIAAHHNLPFSTEVMVTNLKNGKYVFVKITDRMPSKYKGDRHIDLSRIAAEQIDIIRDGKINVEIRIIKRIK